MHIPRFCFCVFRRANHLKLGVMCVNIIYIHIHIYIYTLSASVLSINFLVNANSLLL